MLLPPRRTAPPMLGTLEVQPCGLFELARIGYGRNTKEAPLRLFLIAGEQGFEPQPADPESAVLPLDDSPLVGDTHHRHSIPSRVAPRNACLCHASWLQNQLVQIG